MVGVTPRHCTICSHPSSTPRPLKGSDDTLERRTTADLAIAQNGAVTQGERSTSPPSPPALRGNPQPCVAILDAVKRPPVLWEPVPMGRHHADPCAARIPPSARPSKQCMNN
jgi:hypothetical protein